MSQIPRRTTLSMTQPPKVRKTPTLQSTPSQPVLEKRPLDSTPMKTIEVEAPILIEDPYFGDSLENHKLIQVLSSVEEKSPAGTNGSAGNQNIVEAQVARDSPTVISTSNGAVKGKEAASSSSSSTKRVKPRKVPSDGVQETADDQSSTTSMRSSVEPLEMESLLIPDDDDLVETTTSLTTEKSVCSTDSPRPNKTPGKVVRLAKGLRLSPFRKADQQALDDVSTIVNLSTVSEQSVENHSNSPAAQGPKNGAGDGVATEEGVAESTHGTAEVSEGSTRRISARRTYATNRPLREMSFRNATREAYRRNGNGTAEENSNETTNDSVNATVGSELAFHMDDLPETPAALGQKRRRDSSDGEGDDSTAPPEPKKSLFQTYCSVM